MTVDDTAGVLAELLHVAYRWHRLTIQPGQTERIAATMTELLDLTGRQLVDVWVEPDPDAELDPAQRLDAVVARCASGAPAVLPRRAKLINGKLIPPPPDRRPPPARPPRKRRRSPPAATPASTIGP